MESPMEWNPWLGDSPSTGSGCSCPLCVASRAPLLYRLVALEKNYASAIQRCCTHPREARYENYSCFHDNDDFDDDDISEDDVPFGFTALHHITKVDYTYDIFLASQHQTEDVVEVVKALITAYPEAMNMKDPAGRTPLHYALSSDAEANVVSALLEANIDSIDVMFQAPEGGKMLSVLQYMGWCHQDAIDELIEHVDDTDEDERIDFDDEDFCHSYHADFVDILMLEKLNLLVKALAHGITTDGMPSGKKWRFLHACLSIPDCPTTILRLALRYRPEQIVERDESGRLPLHIALLNRSIKNEKVVIIQELIEAFPASAGLADPKGRLPLILAIEHGKEWESCIEPVLRASPTSLTTRDVRKNLYPFMAAAAAKRPLSLTYQLLVTCPELERFWKAKKRCPRKGRGVKRLKASPSATTDPKKQVASKRVTRSMNKARRSIRVAKRI